MELGTQDHSHTKGCPNKVAHDNHGKIYIGRYPFQKWIDESINPHWDEIRSAWSRGKDKDSLHKKYQDKKREQAHLKTTISELLTKKLRMEAYIASIITDELSSAIPMSEITGSSDSFGGRSEKVSKKGNKSWLVWSYIRYMLGVMCKINIYYNPKCNYNQTHQTTNYGIIGNITTSERLILSTERKVSATIIEPYHGRCKIDRFFLYCDGTHNRNHWHHIHTLKLLQDIIGIHIKFIFHKKIWCAGGSGRSKRFDNLNVLFWWSIRLSRGLQIVQRVQPRRSHHTWYGRFQL